jgi:formylglycine-generating enzyme required for sulfatase activity
MARRMIRPKTLTRAALDEARAKPGYIDLSQYTSLDGEVAEILVAGEQDLDLSGLRTLPPDVATVLSRHRGVLLLNRLRELSDLVALQLSEQDGVVYLSDVEAPTPQVEQTLLKHRGMVALSGTWITMKDLRPEMTVTNAIGIDLVQVPNAVCMLGSPNDEVGRRDLESLNMCAVDHEYFIASTPVTQAQYASVVGDAPSRFSGASRPVERVSWYEAIEFCERLSQLPEERRAGRVYRLPSQQEWEYACRAGSATAFCCGDDWRQLEDYAWFKSNSGDTTAPVAEKLPNAWGLYDMHGNVFEWCSDAMLPYPRVSHNESPGYRGTSVRVRRGGCWLYDHNVCRSACIDFCNPSYRFDFLGFRVAMTHQRHDAPVP